MATTNIERLDDAIKAVEVKIAMIDKQLSEKGLSEEKAIALLNQGTELLKKQARLEDQKTKLEGSAPSGNPINLSQSLHKVFECVVVVSFPLFCRGPPLPHIFSIIGNG